MPCSTAELFHHFANDFQHHPRITLVCYLQVVLNAPEVMRLGRPTAHILTNNIHMQPASVYGARGLNWARLKLRTSRQVQVRVSNT